MWELAKKGIYACALAMPTPDEPKVEEWISEISRVTTDEKDEYFLVGHSLGSVAVLRYLEKTNRSISGAILVSGPVNVLLPEKTDSSLRNTDNFLEKDFDISAIRSHCKNIIVIHAKDDEKVPYEHAEKLSKMLGCKLITLETGGHLSAMDGVIEFPEVLEVITEMFSAV